MACRLYSLTRDSEECPDQNGPTHDWQVAVAVAFAATYSGGGGGGGGGSGGGGGGAAAVPAAPRC